MMGKRIVQTIISPIGDCYVYVDEEGKKHFDFQEVGEKKQGDEK